MAEWTRRRFLLGAVPCTGAGLMELSKPARGEPPPASNGFAAPELLAMQSVAEALMRKHDVPGLSVAIARDDRLVYARAFGLADREKGTPATQAHLFRIASVSKPITSVTIFRLIQAGKLKLTDTVFGSNGVLGTELGTTPYGPHIEAITIEHLLTHTCGGWQNDGTDPMFSHPAMDQRQLISWALDHLPLSHLPGSNFAYSNFGYCILGRVIEKVTGSPYSEAVHKETLRRCGIKRMRIAGNTREARAEGEVIYYGQSGEDPYSMQVSRMDAHGGWLASPTDLVRLLVRVDGFPQKPDILSSASLRSMTTASAANPGYAKGWSVNSANNWWHNGSLPGTTTIMARIASGFCWAALTNTRRPNSSLDGDLDRMMWDIVARVSDWPTWDLF